MVFKCPSLIDTFGIINRIERIWHWKQPIKLQLKLRIFSICWIHSIFRESKANCLRKAKNIWNYILRMCGVTFALIYGCRQLCRRKKKDEANKNSSRGKKPISLSNRDMKHRSAILTRTRPESNRTISWSNLSFLIQ